MFNINIIYIVLSLQLDNNKQYQYCVLLNQEAKLPSVTIQPNMSILDARKTCIKLHTDLELMWLDDKLLDLEIIDNELNIYYTCSLPIETPIHNAKFISIDTKKNISHFIQRAIART